MKISNGTHLQLPQRHEFYHKITTSPALFIAVMVRNFLYIFVETFSWLGLWNIFEYHLWNGDSYQKKKNIIYMCIGATLTSILRLWFFRSDYVPWGFDDQSLDLKSFYFKRKLLDFFKYFLDIVTSTFCWAGSWAIFDGLVSYYSIKRDVLYFTIPLGVMFFFDVFLRHESIHFYYNKYLSKVEKFPKGLTNNQIEVLIKEHNRLENMD
eukprot:TRINITY_DN5099_c0_g1_i1.p1 TRINITY_DN5099_c0_g1~~TRINITY_DN5099_c0_g1_i1.p1  ORF type:complete len:209 (-),score=18.01 TRINITY_DN5099_c0_g1_i1:66-692(-)